MAVSNYIRTISFTAGEDLSDAQNYLVVPHTVAGEVVIAGAGENAIGVNLENAADTEVTGVMCAAGEVVEVVAGAAVAYGALVMSDATGRAITATATNTVVGIALGAATAADEMITIMWNNTGILAA